MPTPLGAEHTLLKATRRLEEGRLLQNTGKVTSGEKTIFVEHTLKGGVPLKLSADMSSETGKAPPRMVTATIDGIAEVRVPNGPTADERLVEAIKKKISA